MKYRTSTFFNYNVQLSQLLFSLKNNYQLASSGSKMYGLAFKRERREIVHILGAIRFF